MTTSALTVFAILAIMSVLLIMETVSVELVVSGAVLVLYFLDILSLDDLFTGFSNSLVILLASLFIVGGALLRTGVASAASSLVSKWAGSEENQLRSTLVSVSAVMSSLMSSTGTVAMMIPMVADLAKKSGKNSARFLLPVAYGCLVGGMLTLIGTPPNLIVQQTLSDGGREPFNFFSFTPFGLIVLIALVAYYYLFAHKLLPQSPCEEGDELSATSLELTEDHELTTRLANFEVPETSPYCHQNLEQLNLRKRFGINIIALHSKTEGENHLVPTSAVQIKPGQVLLVCGPPDGVRSFAEAGELKGVPLDQDPVELARRHRASEVLITPRSPLIGKTLASSHFQERFGVTVISILRRGKALELQPNPALQIGDSLLLVGSNSELKRLSRENRSFLMTVLSENAVDNQPTRREFRIALAITASMAIFMAINIFPPVIVGVVAAFLLIATGCLTIEDAYRSISWQSLLVIACMLPVATALERTGGIDTMAQGLVGHLSTVGPRAVLAGLFLVTALFSQFISNTATTIIMAPVALRAAESMALAPEAYLMTVAVAASAAFATPMGSPVNLLVVNPGNYRFKDFVKNGLPLQTVVLIAAVVVLPFLFPMGNLI